MARKKDPILEHLIEIHQKVASIPVIQDEIKEMKMNLKDGLYPCPKEKEVQMNTSFRLKAMAICTFVISILSIYAAVASDVLSQLF